MRRYVSSCTTSTAEESLGSLPFSTHRRLVGEVCLVSCDGFDEVVTGRPE